MRKLRLVKVIVPEVVAYFCQGAEALEPEYNCSYGMGVAKEYKCCPYCGAVLAWDKVMHPSVEFKKLFDRL